MRVAVCPFCFNFVRSSRAFTMIELLSVVVLIAVIVVLALPWVGDYASWAQQTTTRRTVAVLNESLNEYRALGGLKKGYSMLGSHGEGLTINATTLTEAAIKGLRDGFIHKGKTLAFIRPNEDVDLTTIASTGEKGLFRFVTNVNAPTSTEPEEPIDADAQAIIDAIEDTGVSLSVSQESAILTFVTTGKADGWWDKMLGIYGLVGGTAASAAINWKTPGTYNLTWNGTINYNARGVSSSTGGYAATGMIASTLFSDRLISLSTYIYASGGLLGSAFPNSIGVSGTYIKDASLGLAPRSSSASCFQVFGGAISDTYDYYTTMPKVSSDTAIVVVRSTGSSGLGKADYWIGSSGSTVSTTVNYNSGVLAREIILMRSGNPDTYTYNTFGFFGIGRGGYDPALLGAAITQLQTDLGR
jgi:prepilin-type N-terminal cleavage/methylation domain-containing protein